MSKKAIGVLVMLVAVGVLAGVAAAQGPPGNAGPPGDVTTGPPGDAGPPDDVDAGPPEDVTTGPPENVTRGPSENVTVGPPEGVAEFVSTSPLGPGQVDPNSLSGKIRVESQYVSNTSIELVNDTAANSSLDITVTGNATNVTFFLQKQAVEASQDIENVTMEVDGEPAEFGMNGSGGENWITFEIEHFSTRTVTFKSAGTGGSGDNGGSPDVGNGPPDGAVSDNSPFSGDDDNPVGRSEVIDRLVEWNTNETVDGTEYTRDEIIGFIVDWNQAQA